MVREIVDYLLEAGPDDESFKEVYAPEIKKIEVYGREWWRRGAGGMYFTARIYINDKLVHILPENGGTGQMYLYTAFQWLRDRGYISLTKSDSPWGYCQKAGIELINDLTEVRRERDLDRPVREAAEDEDFKQVYGPEVPELTLQEIKARCPGFFNRENTKFFGTKKVYKYPGNYVLLKNVKHHRQMWGPGQLLTNYVLYQFKRTEDTPKGDLFHVCSARDPEDARKMIKSNDFRDWRHRAAGLIEASEADEFKEVYTGSDILREVGKMRLVRDPSGTCYVETDEDAHPKRVEVRQKDALTLAHSSDQEFLASSVWEIGCGVFGGPDPEEVEESEEPEFKELYDYPREWSYSIEGPDDAGYYRACFRLRGLLRPGYIERNNRAEVEQLAQMDVNAFNVLQLSHPYDHRTQIGTVWDWYRQHAPKNQ